MKHRMIARVLLAGMATAAAMLGSACTMKSQEAPALTGPSEFGTSITVAVSPDILTQDGASQSLVTIMAHDATGAPLRSVSLRAEISVNGVRADFGTISARNLVTDSSGRATLVYTAPTAGSGAAVDDGTVVDIVVTPIGSDFGNSTSRLASIRLVPPGIIIPPDGLQPRFTFTPSSPGDHQGVYFDASTSTSPANNPIATYRWAFGDGATASGTTATHQVLDRRHLLRLPHDHRCTGAFGLDYPAGRCGGGTRPNSQVHRLAHRSAGQPARELQCGAVDGRRWTTHRQLRVGLWRWRRHERRRTPGESLRTHCRAPIPSR